MCIEHTHSSEGSSGTCCFLNASARRTISHNMASSNVIITRIACLLSLAANVQAKKSYTALYSHLQLLHSHEIYTLSLPQIVYLCCSGNVAGPVFMQTFYRCNPPFSRGMWHVKSMHQRKEGQLLWAWTDKYIACTLIHIGIGNEPIEHLSSQHGNSTSIRALPFHLFPVPNLSHSTLRPRISIMWLTGPAWPILSKTWNKIRMQIGSLCFSPPSQN